MIVRYLPLNLTTALSFLLRLLTISRFLHYYEYRVQVFIHKEYRNLRSMYKYHITVIPYFICPPFFSFSCGRCKMI